MIQHHNSAAHAPSRGIVIRSHQGTHSRICSQNARLCQRRRQLLSFTQQNIHLLGSYQHIVHLLKRHFSRSRPNQTNRITGHENIRIRRLPATVEHHPVYPMPENQQCPFRRHHPHLHTGFRCNPMTPNSSGIHHHIRIISFYLFCLMIYRLHARNPIAHFQEVRHLMVGKNHSAMRFGIQNVRRRQPERVYRPVRHPHRSDDRRISGRL